MKRTVRATLASGAFHAPYRLSLLRRRRGTRPSPSSASGPSASACCSAPRRPARVPLAADLIAQRLAVARRCGADWTGDAGASRIAAAISQQVPDGVDVAFECSGDPACLEQAVAVLAPGGTVAVAGIPASDRVSFDIHALRRRELRLVNVRRQCGCVGPVIEMIHAGRIDARPLLTHRFPLERIGEAFELVAGYDDGVVKAVIDLSGGA